MPPIYDDDNDDYDYKESIIPLNDIISQEPPSNAITHVLRTLDLEDSLIMGNEELSTILEKESDEFIKSSVEDLVPILSEFEDISKSDSEYILPSYDNFSPINIPEEKPVTFSNTLFDSNNDFTSSDDESLFDEDIPDDNVKIYSNSLFDFEDDDDVKLLLHCDPSTPIMSVVSVLEGFTNELPLKDNDDLFDLESKEDEWKKILYDPPINDLMSEDKVFDLGICVNFFSPTYAHIKVLSVLWGNRLPVRTVRGRCLEMDFVHYAMLALEIRSFIIRILSIMLKKIDHPQQPMPPIYDDDDDDYDYEESTIPLNDIISQEPPSNAITPVIPTLEPDDSLIMGNEELSTISKKKSDEFIKSSVEDLVLIPSESKDISGSDSEYTLPSYDNFSSINVPEENRDVNPLFDEVLEDTECKDSYDSNLDESTFLVTPLFDSNEDKYLTPGDDVKILLHRDPSTPIMSVVFILKGFTNEPPLEEKDDLFDLDSKENEWKKILYDAPIDDLMSEDKVFDPGILSPFLISSESEDTIFDIGIFASHFSLKPVASHRNGTFMCFNIYLNIFNESPTEIFSSTHFNPNITMIWGESS
nr:hypothetical protein [Tanacetum cinerariifolium]